MTTYFFRDINHERKRENPFNLCNLCSTKIFASPRLCVLNIIFLVIVANFCSENIYRKVFFSYFRIFFVYFIP